MIISKAYAKKLIKSGKAKIASINKPDSNGIVYVAIDRLDKKRVDHYID